MSIPINRHLFWLTTMGGDRMFTHLQTAAEFIAEEMIRKRETNTWQENYIQSLHKITKRGDSWGVTDVSEEMFKQATIILWNPINKTKRELDDVKMDVVKLYDKHKGTQQGV